MGVLGILGFLGTLGDLSGVGLVDLEALGLGVWNVECPVIVGFPWIFG